MKKGFFAVIFILLMCVIGGVIIVTFLKLHWSDSNPEVEEKVDAPAVEVVDSPQSTGGLLKILEYENTYKKCLAPLSNLFSGILGWYNKSIQGDIILSGESMILRLSNGYYTFPFPYSRSEYSWNNLLDFTAWLKSRGVGFFQLILADKGDDSFGTLPDGAPDGYSLMAEEYKAFLEENAIDYLEAKPKMLALNSDFYYWFYKADHHWNVHAGLLMAQECAKKLNGIEVAADESAVIKENFRLVAYPGIFLGSLGQELGFWQKEDMEVYYPNRETDFQVSIPADGVVQRGPMNKTLISEQYILTKTTSYFAFLGRHPLVQIENINSNNETRVLVYGMSKARVILPYLALSVRYLDMINPQYYEGSIRLFIEETLPDAVIFCMDVPWVGGEEYWKLK